MLTGRYKLYAEDDVSQLTNASLNRSISAMVT